MRQRQIPKQHHPAALQEARHFGLPGLQLETARNSWNGIRRWNPNCLLSSLRLQVPCSGLKCPSTKLRNLESTLPYPALIFVGSTAVECWAVNRDRSTCKRRSPASSLNGGQHNFAVSAQLGHGIGQRIAILLHGAPWLKVLTLMCLL